MGYALRHNRQHLYESPWHMHDCAMLLWAQGGALESSWMDDADGRPLPATTSLTRGTAVFLPASTVHRTTALTSQQQHGELYLAPDLLRGFRRRGVVRLDGAVTSMLDALLAPALQQASAEHLVRAVVAQCAHAKPVAHTRHERSVISRMIEIFESALDAEDRLPSVADVAHTLGITMRMLQRQCEFEAKASPVSIRRRLLAARARNLMNDGLSLAQVSLKLDFANSGHLSRLLKSVES